MKIEECDGCHEQRLVVQHDIINTESIETVGTIKLCLNCAGKMMVRKLQIQD